MGFFAGVGRLTVRVGRLGAAGTVAVTGAHLVFGRSPIAHSFRDLATDPMNEANQAHFRFRFEEALQLTTEAAERRYRRLTSAEDAEDKDDARRRKGPPPPGPFPVARAMSELGESGAVGHVGATGRGDSARLDGTDLTVELGKASSVRRGTAYVGLGLAAIGLVTGTGALVNIVAGCDIADSVHAAAALGLALQLSRGIATEKLLAPSTDAKLRCGTAVVDERSFRTAAESGSAAVVERASPAQLLKRNAVFVLPEMANLSSVVVGAAARAVAGPDGSARGWAEATLDALDQALRAASMVSAVAVTFMLGEMVCRDDGRHWVDRHVSQTRVVNVADFGKSNKKE